MTDKQEMDIVERLRLGEEVWRVANPDTGAYCMEFSWENSLNPERDAKEWLSNHLREWPNSMHAGKGVIKKIITASLHTEAADEIERLRADLVSCRGTVKTELHHYERLAMVHGKTVLATNYEAEAQRLSDLLDRIDSIKDTP
jgi:hypothetical protein